MGVLSINRTYADGVVPFESDIDAIRDALLILLNSSKLDSANFQSASITADKIADGAVISPRIITAAVTAAKILDGAVTTPKINAGAITAAKIAADAFTNSKVEDRAITLPSRSALSSLSIGQGTIELTASSTQAITATSTDWDLADVLATVSVTGEAGDVFVFQTVNETSAQSYIRIAQSGTNLTAIGFMLGAGAPTFSTVVSTQRIDFRDPGRSNAFITYPTSMFRAVYTLPASSTFNFGLKARVITGGSSTGSLVARLNLIAYKVKSG
jgi:hypothetical protein